MYFKDFPEKIRLIFLPTLFVLLSLSALYPLLAWLVFIKLHLFEIDRMIWELVIPILLSAFLYLWLLRPRFHLFRLKRKKSSDTGHAALGFFAIVLLLAPVLMATSYVSKASYDLVRVATPGEIDPGDHQRYYRIDNYVVAAESALAYQDSYTSGKYDHTLNFTLHIVAPFAGSKTNNTPGAIWYGANYRQDVARKASEEVQEHVYRAFTEKTEKDWTALNFHEALYYEVVNDSRDIKNYREAIKEGGYANYADAIVLESRTEPFGRRANGSFKWMFLLFGISLIGLFLFSILPAFSEVRIDNYRQGRVVRDREFEAFAKYFIPRGDHFMVSILIDLNIIVFLVMIACGVSPMSPDGADLVRMGGLVQPSQLNGEYWRIFSAMFMHAGIMHLVYNMFALAVAGTFLEIYLGRGKFLAVYLITGCIAGFASLAYGHFSVTVGASGAIFGMFGVLVGLLLTKSLPREAKPLLWFVVVIYGGLSLVFGLFMPGIDNAAHIGGLIGGILVGLVLHFAGLIKREGAGDAEGGEGD
jgi:rhomboid protease GluP